jgi:large subunit ribosomal protein L25
MEKITLKAQVRNELGNKTNQGRKKGLVPSVVYGKGIDSQCLWVNALELGKLLNKSGESVIIDLKIQGQNDRNVLIHEIQKDPVRDDFLHVDFYQVNMAEKIETEVELVFIGESPVVKETGGVLVKNVDKVRIKCLPGDLPSHIDVDISLIKTFDDHILAKDIKISEKVEMEIDPETVIALVVPPRSEEELSELEQKVEEDVTKVEGVVKEEPAAESKDEAKPAEGEKKA